MRRMKRFGLFLVLMLATACAPVVYDTTYREYRVPARNTYFQPSHHHKSSYQRVRPIEITLYASNSFQGIYFQPIHIVIADGEYVEIPVKDKRGRYTKIYAHYHKNNLHFDSDMNCRAIHGSSKYIYDSRWDKGHKYTKINIGKDYDLSWLRLKIRNLPAGSPYVKKGRPVKVVNKTIITHRYEGKTPVKRPVVIVQPSDKRKKVVVHEQNDPLNRHTPKTPGYGVVKQHVKNTKPLIIKDNIGRNGSDVVIKTVKRPTIVKKIVKDKQPQHIYSEKVVSQNKKQYLVHKSVRKSTKTIGGQNNRVDDEAHDATKVEKTKMLSRNDKKSLRGSRSVKRPEESMPALDIKSVRISLAGGTVMVDGKKSRFAKISLKLKEGESRDVALVTKGGLKARVPISYHNGILKIASNGNQFKVEPAWAKGKTYKINTAGDSRLGNVKLTVHAL